jgi:hypothetical protein
MWCVADLDEEYIARMEDVLAVYEKPLSEREPVVCIDEKPVALHADIRPPLPMRPGRVARPDCEYKRCGTANAFCGVEPKAGQHFTQVTPDRSSPQFADYLLEIAEHYPQADTIHRVLDNLSSHTRKALAERFGETPGGWLWGPLHDSFHPEARQLAEPGGDRDQSVLPPVPGAAPDRRLAQAGPRSPGMEPARKSQPGENQLEIRPQKGQKKVSL